MPSSQPRISGGDCELQKAYFDLMRRGLDKMGPNGNENEKIWSSIGALLPKCSLLT